MGMGLPDLLILTGLVLVFMGMALVLMAFLRTAPWSSGRSTGVVLIGPVLIPVSGRASKLVSALALITILTAFALGFFLVLRSLGVV